MLFRSSLRYLLKHPLQVILSVVGVALGVAVVVGIDLSIQSASKAFEWSTDRIAGKATHRITSGAGGVDEDIYTKLKVENGMQKIAPVVERYVTLTDWKEQLHLMGVDPFAEGPFRSYSHSIAGADNHLLRTFLTQSTGIISTQTASKLDVQTGDTLRLQIGSRYKSVRIAGILRGVDSHSRQILQDMLITDISTAQQLLNMQGNLSYIDLIAPSGPSGNELITDIKSSLPEGVNVERSKSRSSAIEKMIAAFNTNLSALSFLALIVGMFLIYNTMTFSVLQRRSQIGRLQALGVTRSEIFTMILTEAGIIGLLGTLLGVGVGLLMGKGLVHMVSQTINDLYFTLTVTEMRLSFVTIFKGILLGMGATLLTAFVPAREATKTPPRLTLSRASLETGILRRIPTLTLIGLGITGIGALILWFPGRSVIMGYGGLLPVMVGYALMVPGILILLVNLFRPIAGYLFGLKGRMAVQNIRDQLSRSSVAVAALAIAVSAVIGVSTSIGSFRHTVTNWLGYTLNADIYLSVPDNGSRRGGTGMDESILDAVEKIDGVNEINTLLRTSITVNGRIADLEALELTEKGYKRFQLKSGSPGKAWRDFREKKAVIVSEPFAYHHGVEVGDTLHLQADKGIAEFPVAGVFYDYSTDVGTILMQRSDFRKHWSGEGYTSLSVYTAEDQSTADLINELEDTLSERAVVVRSNRELRNLSMEIFDRTFRVTRVLQLLTVLVALIGVFSALMSLQLERKREIGVLRAIGFTPGQIRKIMMGQTSMMGLISGILALPLGYILTLVLVFVINKRSFGWTLELSMTVEILWQALLVSVLAAVLAGIYPAIKMGRMNIIESLRNE